MLVVQPAAAEQVDLQPAHSGGSGSEVELQLTQVYPGDKDCIDTQTNSRDTKKNLQAP